jgi:hypothetical protein
MPDRQLQPRLARFHPAEHLGHRPLPEDRLTTTGVAVTAVTPAVEMAVMMLSGPAAWPADAPGFLLPVSPAANSGKELPSTARAPGNRAAQAARIIQSPILSPDVSSIVISIASRHACASVITDRSWPVLLDVKIAKARSDRMSKPLPAIHHVADVILVPGEGSRIGNVTGGRKLARHNLMVGRIRTAPEVPSAPGMSSAADCEYRPRASASGPDRPG